MKTKILPLVLLTLSQGVLAQQIPGAGSQLQQLPSIPVPPPAAPEIRIEETTAPPVPGAEAVRVTVKALRITGTSAFSPAELVAASQFRPGSSLTLADLQVIASRITQHYRSHGYFVARAYLPAQSIADNVVTIAVSEGRYGNVTLRNKEPLVGQCGNGPPGRAGWRRRHATRRLTARSLSNGVMPSVPTSLGCRLP